MKRSLATLCLTLAVTALFVPACTNTDLGLPQNQAVGGGANANRQSRDLLFSENWKFSLADDANFKNAAFDDAAWRTLDLPHDYSIEGPFEAKWASGTGFLPTGIGWYRKTFTVSPEDRNKKITIRFDGVMNHATVFCNGQQVGERAYGYSSFTCDLTPAINVGGQNIIAVRVDHKDFADSRWYQGSGIYRDVFLNVTDKVHIDTYGNFITTPRVSAESADVHVQTLVKNESTESANVTLDTRIQDARGATVAMLQDNAQIAAGGEKQFAITGFVSRPALWGPGSPNMYTAQTTVRKNGLTVDEVATPFGIRSFNFDAQKGFSINGKSMKLKGVCLHHDAGALGAAVPIKVWERRLKILADAGVNAIRTAHNPPAPEFLDLCDRMGFLVQDEAFDEWTGAKNKWVTGRNNGTAAKFGYAQDFEKWADIDARDMVLRDRNHPSIIMWSIGNEIDYNNDPFPPGAPQLPPIAERLKKAVKAVDTTRPVTAALAFPDTTLFNPSLDIEGYNYMERFYDPHHAARPNRVIYGSENGHGLAAWQAVADNDFIAGQFLWTGIDYLGEAGTFPGHGSGAGLLNLAGFPKNQYYFRQSLWAEKPMVYLSTSGIGGGGRGRGRGAPGAATAPGAPTTISCFTNCDTVELFHDGVSLGSKPRATPGEVLTWPVPFSGTLKAVGKKGEVTTTFELKKAGPTAALKLLADTATLKRDGRDVAHIELDVTDATGILVPDATLPIACSITGPAKIIGIENGNQNTTEPYSARTRSTFQGKLLIYVQSLKEPGEATLTVSAPGLTGGTVKFTVR